MDTKETAYVKMVTPWGTIDCHPDRRGISLIEVGLTQLRSYRETARDKDKLETDIGVYEDLLSFQDNDLCGKFVTEKHRLQDAGDYQNNECVKKSLIRQGVWPVRV